MQGASRIRSLGEDYTASSWSRWKEDVVREEKEDEKEQVGGEGGET